MKLSKQVSNLMLERYRLGELAPEDQKAVIEALACDETLVSRLIDLDESDRVLRQSYPFDKFLSIDFYQKPQNMPQNINEERHKKQKRVFGLLQKRGIAIIAAAVLLCVILPVTYFTRSGAKATSMSGEGLTSDRAKGSIPADCELSLYLKGDRELPLHDRAALSEGSTVQLAYKAPEGEHYGVIFSIDGRSIVTAHYPYRKGQSSLLASGRRTFLDEAYTLDDAPDYEVFVFVISSTPLDFESVLSSAQRIAAGSRGYGVLEDKIRSSFDGCEVETQWILKN